MSKINLNDSTIDIVMKMCEGNPGAINVIMEMLNTENNKIDPDSLMGGLIKILSLDDMGIYGSDIYVLYNDLCDKQVVKVFALLRGHQLGFLDTSTLKNACSKQDRSGKKMIDFKYVYNNVLNELPNFKRFEV